MQKAKLVLTKLYKKSKNKKTFIFQRLYRNLFNPDFFINAYSEIYQKEGNLTRGINNETIDGFKIQKIEQIIKKLRHEKYYPSPVRRTYIRKKNGKQRPLGIHTFEDKIIQEVIRQILEAIYEPLFSDNSHGFRPNRSCHTALHQIKTKGTGSNWCIEGDIQSFFDSIDHNILIELLNKKINDGRFLELIRKFLKAGYMENGIKRNTITGTSQGGIISPILSNIYLHEFDKYVETLKMEFSKGKKRKTNNLYARLDKRKTTLIKHGFFREANKIRKEKHKIPSGDPLDPNYKQLQYVRYADDFVVMIIGSKSETLEIKNKINMFLKQTLNINLNDEKTLTTNLLKDKVRFLGYNICKAHNNSHIRKNSLGHKMRLINGRIQLLIPAEIIQDKIKPFREKNKPIHMPYRIHLPILDIISIYNSEIRGLYNYYSLANNVAQKMQMFKYYHYFSLIKTIANKERSTVYKTIKKHGISVKRKDKTGTRPIIGVKYKLKTGEEKILTYYNEPLTKRRIPFRQINIPDHTFTSDHIDILKRLNARECELCHITGNKKDFEIHHVRKLKDLIRKWKKRGKDTPKHIMLMARINRKTLVLCKDCHVNVHKGLV
jgi:group II intron reverse transcriptase/maturase